MSLPIIKLLAKKPSTHENVELCIGIQKLYESFGCWRSHLLIFYTQWFSTLARLWTRKEKEIAIVTHSVFLFELLKGFGNDRHPSIKSEICK